MQGLRSITADRDTADQLMRGVFLCHVNEKCIMVMGFYLSYVLPIITTSACKGEAKLRSAGTSPAMALTNHEAGLILFKGLWVVADKKGHWLAADACSMAGHVRTFRMVHFLGLQPVTCNGECANGPSIERCIYMWSGRTVRLGHTRNS